MKEQKQFAVYPVRPVKESERFEIISGVKDNNHFGTEKEALARIKKLSGGKVFECQKDTGVTAAGIPNIIGLVDGPEARIFGYLAPISPAHKDEETGEKIEAVNEARYYALCVEGE